MAELKLELAYSHSSYKKRDSLIITIFSLNHRETAEGLGELVGIREEENIKNI